MSHPLFTATILTLLGAFPATAQTLTDTELGIIGADLRFGFSNHACNSICNTKNAATAASGASAQCSTWHRAKGKNTDCR